MLIQDLIQQLQQGQKPAMTGMVMVFKSRVCEQRTAAARIRSRRAQHRMAPAAMVDERAGIRNSQA